MNSTAHKGTAPVRFAGDICIAELNTGLLGYMHGDKVVDEILAAAVDHDARFIIFDMKRVEWLEATGIARLVRTHKWAHARGGRFALLRPAPKIKELFYTMMLNKVIPIYDDRETALGRIREDRLCKDQPETMREE